MHVRNPVCGRRKHSKKNLGGDDLFGAGNAAHVRQSENQSIEFPIGVEEGLHNAGTELGTLEEEPERIPMSDSFDRQRSVCLLLPCVSDGLIDCLCASLSVCFFRECSQGTVEMRQGTRHITISSGG